MPLMAHTMQYQSWARAWDQILDLELLMDPGLILELQILRIWAFSAQTEVSQSGKTEIDFSPQEPSKIYRHKSRSPK